jgi:hypothetical protein
VLLLWASVHHGAVGERPQRRLHRRSAAVLQPPWCVTSCVCCACCRASTTLQEVTLPLRQQRARGRRRQRSVAVVWRLRVRGLPVRLAHERCPHGSLWRVTRGASNAAFHARVRTRGAAARVQLWRHGARHAPRQQAVRCSRSRRRRRAGVTDAQCGCTSAGVHSPNRRTHRARTLRRRVARCRRARAQPARGGAGWLGRESA